jgi:hypothetical protein
MPRTAIEVVVILGLTVIGLAFWSAIDPYVRWLLWETFRHPFSESHWDPERRRGRSKTVQHD